MDFAAISQLLISVAIRVGVQILAALVFWILGRWLIGVAVRLISTSLERQHVDPTLLRYIGSIVSVMLNIVLVVGILGYFGVETTTFAALLAGAGIAIGAAWGGLLSNFAAGAFVVVLRPFKVGDFIHAGGVTGTVREIGLFATTMNTPDNVVTFVGNNKIFSDTIQNFSMNSFRRVDLVAQLSHSVDVGSAIALLQERIRKIPNVISEPGPEIEVLAFTLAGPVLAVRPHCNNDHSWQVYFATNRTIRDAFGEAGYATPEQHLAVRGLEK
jgi:small conductance mechanosensitive channel